MAEFIAARREVKRIVKEEKPNKGKQEKRNEQAIGRRQRANETKIRINNEETIV